MMKAFRATLALALAIVALITTSEALSFAIIGDWGMGGRAAGWQTEMRSADEVNDVCAKINCNFTISVGDNIYVGDVMRGLQDSFEDMFTSRGPFFPSIGNHDNVGPQIDYTKRNKRWKFYQPYYTRKMPIDDSGYTVQIFAVNTMDGGLAGGGQLTWLENELQNSDARWKIIFGHYPTTGSGRHKRVGTVGRIHQLMEKYGAQAYFCGHDHILEVSNSNGRVLGMSGAMARGGMMLRGIGGGARRFTLTQPSEHSPYAQDWPGHGFMTADLSPNVMTVALWDQCGGVQYEFSVTHDWIKRAGTMPSAVQNEWPAEDIVLQAYKDELALQKGPAGGTYFAPGGDEVSGASAPATPAPITPAPTPAPPGSTPQPTTPLPVVTLPRLELVTEMPVPVQAVPAYIRYAVSTECVPCNGKPTSGEPLTIFIDGAPVTSKSRLYLTNSVTGCESSAQPKLVEGTKIVSPVANVIAFTPTGPKTNVWVCYSIDAGKSFARLSRVDNDFDEAYFLLLASLADAANAAQGPSAAAATNSPVAAAPSSAPAAVQAPAPPAPTAPPALAPAPGNGGHNTGVVVVIGVLCAIIGAFASVYAKQWVDERRHQQRVPTSEHR